MDNNVSEECLEEFVFAARRTARHGLALCGSGNLSWRIDRQHMLVTTAGAWLSEMTKDQVAICRIQDGTCINSKKPSIELGFHRAILSERQDVNVVLHFQSPCATTLACSRELAYDRFFVIPEIPYYIGPVAVVPYMAPGSADLAAAVTSAIRKHDLAILQNHGQVTVGRDLRDAFQKAVYFEFASAICLRTAKDVQTLGEEAVESLYQARQANQQQS
jgi:ribulose-5-phosphate 4-epimerase/fuculose-1-phosphate aldolase